MSSCSPERAVGPSWNARRGPRWPPSIEFYPGSDLLSHAVASAVPSAQGGLTSVFGMGTLVAPPAMPPGTLAAAMPPPTTETLKHSQAPRHARFMDHRALVVRNPHEPLVPLS